MLKLLKFYPLVLAAVFCATLDSCRPPIKFETSVYGIASISSNPVKNGNEVDLFIDNSITIGSATSSTSITTSINGKEIGIPDVRYYIDGQEVGHSSNKDAKFACKYTVSNLQAGEHTLSAEPVPQECGTTFIGVYTSSTIIVE